MLMLPAAQAALDQLLQGNARFRACQPAVHRYSQGVLRSLSSIQKPIAAIIACADSRVSPEIVFDQPLGAIFASRVPGNVASDSAKWMLDIAVQDLKVPLVMVMGHTGCLAIGQLLEGDKGGSGGSLRHAVSKAVFQARAKNPADLHRQAVIENAGLTLQDLASSSYAVSRALADRQVELVASLYEMETGEVKMLERLSPRF